MTSVLFKIRFTRLVFKYILPFPSSFPEWFWMSDNSVMSAGGLVYSKFYAGYKHQLPRCHNRDRKTLTIANFNGFKRLRNM